MTPNDPYSFTASPFPPGHFRVHAVRGREALSKPYRFDVVVSARADLGEDIERLALGQRAVLVIHVGSAPRVIPGVIASVRYQGARPHDETVQYTFRLVPALALLEHQRGSRIFQDKRIHEVVDEVLRGAGMQTRWEITREYPVRPFITQYEETDLAFVRRLLAEAGIFYAFAAPSSGLEDFLGALSSAVAPVSAPDALAFAAGAKRKLPEETVFFGDEAASHPSIAAPALHYSPMEGVVTERDKIGFFETVRRVRSSLAEYREYDPDRPHVLLVGRDEGEKTENLAGGTFAGSLLQGVVHRAYETYEHDGVFLFPDRRGALDAARQIRRRTSRKRITAEGRSAAPELAPGFRFGLEHHPVSDYNREHVVTSIEHRGSVAKGGVTYENSFTCVPADVVFVPAKPKRRVIQSLVTATVVGPSGEDIHVDACGRVKVLFHWDRRRTSDDTASCWIRVVQPWSGAGFGHQFFPRVGMEVAVTFEGGDPDKPIVIGSLYNGTHLPPFPLPAGKAVSGIRTQSTPGGGGHNELSFDDTATKERIHVHAQRDLEEIVRRDHTVTVHGAEIVQVHGGRRASVGRDARDEVRGDREEVVRGDVSIQHMGERTDVVQRNLDQRVGETRAVRVEGRDDLEVRGTAEHRFLGDLTTRVTGNHTIIVGKHEAKRSLTMRIEGGAILSTEDGIELQASGGLTLRCGKTSIRIGEDGIEIQGGFVRVAGEKADLSVNEDGIELTSNGTYAHFGDKLLVKTEKASLSMGTEVKVDGEKILLNSPERATEDPPPEKAPPTEISLVDDAGRPLGGQRFVVLLEDGSQRTGVTDDDGKAKIDLPAGAKAEVRFPELADVARA